MPTRLEREREAREAQAKAQREARDDYQITERDAATGEVTVDPDRAFSGFKQPESAQEVEEFKEAAPDGPFSRQGRDYYVDPEGNLKSVRAGANAVAKHPGWKPATSADVAARDLQKRAGSGWDQFDAGVEAFVRTGAETVGGISKLVAGVTGLPDDVKPEKLAPFAYTDAALDRRDANPWSATAGAVAADIAGQALVRGAGKGAALRRTGLSGLTAEAGEVAVTGKPYSVAEAGIYGLHGVLFEGVAQGVPVALRALRKKPLEASLEQARRAAIADAAAESDPIAKAEKLRANAQPIYDKAQLELDEALASIDERITAAPDRVFAPGVLRRTVSENVEAQSSNLANLRVQLGKAAEVTEILQLQRAADLLEAARPNGPSMYRALRDARKALDDLPESTLAREAVDAVERSLVDEQLWGRAAKNYKSFADAPAEAARNLRVDDIDARAALDAHLERARSYARATSDPKLPALIRKAEQAIVDADAVTGARLMGPSRPPPVPEAPEPTILQKAIRAAVKAPFSNLSGAVGGGFAGAVFGGGTLGGLAGTAVGTATSSLIAPYVDRLANRVAGIGASPAADRWLRGVGRWAKDAAKRNPTKIAGAGLVAASALGADEDGEEGMAGASVGLLTFFLPSGGKRQLRQQLGQALARVRGKERMHVRIATERAAERTAQVLYAFARGEGGLSSESLGWLDLESPEQVLAAQHRIQQHEMIKALGLEGVINLTPGYNPIGAEITEEAGDALLADLHARNAALINSDPFLLRLAKPGRLDVIPGEGTGQPGRTPLEARQNQRMAAEAKLKPDDMPVEARALLARSFTGPGEMTRKLRGGAYEAGLIFRRGDPASGNLRDFIHNQIGEYNYAFYEAVGRRLNRREIAYVEARIGEAVENAIEQLQASGQRAAAPTGPELRVVEPQPEGPPPPPEPPSDFGPYGGGFPRIVEQRRRWVEQAHKQGLAADEILVTAQREVRDIVDRAAHNALLRELTPEEAAWVEQMVLGRAREVTGIEAGSTRERRILGGLRTVQGGGEGAQGVPEFRRLGLPEPTQGDVPMQMKLGLPRQDPVRIVGEPHPSPGGPEARLQRRLAAGRALQEGDVDAEAIKDLRNVQRQFRERALRTYTDRELARVAEQQTRYWGQAFIDRRQDRVGTSAENQRALEYVNATLTDLLFKVREEQLARVPLSTQERASRSVDVIEARDMPGSTHPRLDRLRQQVRSIARHDMSAEEMEQTVAREIERWSDEFVVSENRPPNARELEYATAQLADELESARDVALRHRREVADAKERRAREEEARRLEASRRARKEEIERERVESLMGGRDLTGDEAEAIEADLRRVLIDMGLGPPDALLEHLVRAVDNDELFDRAMSKLRERRKLTPGQSIYAQHQLDRNLIDSDVDTWLDDAVGELARHDTGDYGDDIDDLTIDDILGQMPHELDDWEEYWVRQHWEDRERRLQRAFRDQVDEYRRERKPEEDEESYDDDYGYGAGFRSSSGLDPEDAGLPRARDLDNVGLDEVIVHHAEGVRRVFGEDLSAGDVEDLLGLTTVKGELGASTQLIVHRNEVEFRAQGGGIRELHRTYSPTEGGFTVSHDSFFLSGSEQAQGIMKKVFSQALPAYERLGAVEVHVSCADIGKYLWPKLGFRPSARSEQAAIGRFIDWATTGTHGLSFTPEQRARFETIETLRDVADATVPLDWVEPQLGMLEEAYRSAANHPGEFEKLFIRKGEFALGKLFLIEVGGGWNSGLSLKIDRDDPWYRETLKRIGALALAGIAFEEMLQGWGDTRMEVLFSTSANDDEAAVVDVPEDAEALARQAATRQKLDYLTSQSEALRNTTARALTSPEAQRARTVTARPGITHSAGVSQFVGSQATLRAAYEEKKDTLRRIQREPLVLVEEMAESLADMGEAAPELQRQVVAKTYEVARFLQGKLPGTIGASLMRPDGTPPSETALRQFALYYSAATNPSSVYTDLANNRVRKEQVDTLRELWPEAYQQLKVAVIEQLSQGHRPSIQQRSRLDLLFDFGGALDRGLSPRLVAALDAWREQSAQKPPGAKMPQRRTQPSVASTGALPWQSGGRAA